MMDYTYETDDLSMKAAIGVARAMSYNLYNPVALVNWESGEVYFASGRMMEYLWRKYEVKNGKTSNVEAQPLLSIAQDAWKNIIYPYIRSSKEVMDGRGCNITDCRYLAMELQGISESHRSVFYLMKITPMPSERQNFALVTLSLSSNKASGRVGLCFTKEVDCFFSWDSTTGRWVSRDIPQLTNSEAHLMRLVSNGYKQDELADMLFCSKNTVRSHKKNILEKLEANNFVEAMMNAINGLII